MKNLFLALLFVASSAIAGNCDHLYVTGHQFPVAQTVELCNSFYVVAYSNEVKGPIVSFERFDANKSSVKRVDSFRPDTRLSLGSRAELKDYIKSGYDRGHMTPAADAGSDAEMHDTFLLSNMTPQSKKLNEHNWKDLEMHIRQKAKSITFVATGAIYQGAKLGPDHIGIPVRYYKIVWYADHTQDAFYADNKDDASVVRSSIDEIEKLSGIKFTY